MLTSTIWFAKRHKKKNELQEQERFKVFMTMAD